MNGQIVLCPGYNDGAALQKTMEDMASWGFASCSVVPVGLTKYREKLPKLKPVDREEAAAVIDQVERFGEQCLERLGTRLFFCSDEFYIRAGRDLPDEDFYEGYVQLENGVGMLRSLITEFEAGMDQEDAPPKTPAPPYTMATGVSAQPYLAKLAQKAQDRFGVQGQVVAIVNDFFGHTIDVAGLITGGDLVAQLKGRDLGRRLLIPVNMLRHGGDVFLDDLHVSDVEKALGVPVTVVEQDGFDLLDAILGRK
jgi:putative radical SAM enzyme (TIGR03279 family)